MSIIIFWLAFLAIIWIAVRRNRTAPEGKKSSWPYGAMTVFAFYMVSAYHIRILIHVICSSGDRVVYMGIEIAQMLINPTRLVTNYLPIGCLLKKMPGEATGSEELFLFSYTLWQLVIQDFIIGSVFWLMLTYGIIRLFGSMGKPNKNAYEAADAVHGK